MHVIHTSYLSSLRYSEEKGKEYIQSLFFIYLLNQLFIIIITKIFKMLCFLCIKKFSFTILERISYYNSSRANNRRYFKFKLYIVITSAMALCSPSSVIIVLFCTVVTRIYHLLSLKI